MKKLFTLLSLVCALLVVSACSGKQNKTTTTTKVTTTVTTQTSSTTTVDRGPATVVTIAVQDHLRGNIDPEFKDPITNEYPISGMDNFTRDAKRRAISVVEDKLNVKFEFISYPNNPVEDILQSVLANKPIADLVYLDGGSASKNIVPQNVLKDLSNIGVLKDPENEWMTRKLKLDDLVLGFGDEPMGLQFTFQPLVYNASLVSVCPAAKKMGYPSELFKKGEWTWETFAKYLDELNACGASQGIKGYAGPMAVFAQLAGGSNGGYLVGKSNKIEILDWIESDEPVDGVESFGGYVTKLNSNWDQALQFINDLDQVRGDYLYQPAGSWTDTSSAEIDELFKTGQAYFASPSTSSLPVFTTELSKRGQSLGLVPFPIGPSVEAKVKAAGKSLTDYDAIIDAGYNFLSEGGNALGVPRGVSDEKTEIAVTSYVELIKQSYVELGYETNGKFDYDLLLEVEGRQYVRSIFDVNHDAIGEDQYEMFDFYYEASQYYNPLKSLVGIWNVFYYVAQAPQRYETREDELRKKIWTGDGYNKPAQNAIDEAYAYIVSGQTPVDNVSPSISKVEEFAGSQKITISRSDNYTENGFFLKYFTIKDNVTAFEDLIINFVINPDGADLSAADEFTLAIEVIDAAGNIKSANFTIAFES